MDNYIIAIDGPAGCGKGTIAVKVAKQLGFEYLDTGVFYRAITLKAIRSKIAIDDTKTLISIAKSLNIKFAGSSIYLDNQNVTNEIRSLEVDQLVFPISGIKEIRKIINGYVVKYSNKKNIVVDGRDITTNALPYANIKVYLDANVDIRAKRRFIQNQKRNINSSLDEVKKNIIARDLFDKNKEFGPLKLANDAHYIDTSFLDIEEVVEKIIKLVKEDKA